MKTKFTFQLLAIFGLALLMLKTGTSFAYGELVNPENVELISDANDREINRIQPYSNNPAYWQYLGEQILLIGGSSNDYLFQIDDLIEELDLLIEYGGNYVRNTMSSRDEGNEYPFFFDDEIQMYDLSRWNDAYWDKFEAFLQATYERGIIIQIEIWATYDFYSRPAHVLNGQTAWERNPFNPRNNINYTERNSGLYEQFRSTHGTLINPFFKTVLPLPQSFDFELTPIVLEYQQKFVIKVMSISLDYDHGDSLHLRTPESNGFWVAVLSGNQ